MVHVNPTVIARFALVGMLVALVLVFGRPVAAQSACAPRAIMLDRFAQTYGEYTVAVAVTNRRELILVVASNDGASWSILISQPGGRTCLLMAGVNWRQQRRPAADPKL